MDLTGHVRRADIELRLIPLEEWSVTSAFLFSQNVDLGGEFCMRRNKAWLGQNLTSFNLITFNTAKQKTDIITGLTAIEQFAEHFNTGHDNLAGITKTDDFHFLIDVDHTLFNTSRSNRTTTLDREDVFNRHQERLIKSAFWSRDVFIQLVKKFDNRLSIGTGWVLKSLERGTADDRNIVTGELILSKQLTNLHLHKIEKLRIIDHVALIQEDDDIRHFYLTGEQNVFAGLWHRTIGSGHDKNRTIHLSSTRNHVLYVVSMPGTVDVSVVTLFGFVFLMRSSDGNTTFSFFRRVIDLIERDRLIVTAQLCSGNGSNSSGKSGFTMIHVTNGTNVYVWLTAIKCSFSHN